MPYSPQHKQQSRKKILESAFSCFTHKGFENTSIDEIMEQADMTRGAFYAHFSSKSELYQQAMLSGAQNSAIKKTKPEQIPDKDWIHELVKGYLSEHHVQQKSPPCPLAFLVTDVAVREGPVRKTYTKIFAGMNKSICHRLKAVSESDKERITAITTMLIGAVAICRALDDRKLRRTVLAACESLALTQLDDCGKPAAEGI